MYKIRVFWILSIIFILATPLLYSQTLPQQKSRLALLIGNGDYSLGSLANPVNDVRAMKESLEQRGFDVLKYENLDQKQMKMAIDLFGTQLNNYSVGLFFYAGHGIQVKGLNYLIPIDAHITAEQQVEYDCVQVDRVLGMMESGETDINILILDACRNNPFERSWSRSADGKGLAFMNAPQGTLIAYATAPGSTASDGAGSNGLYTSAILESIKAPDATIIQMFQNVRTIVSAKSYQQQIPWESTSLVGDFYFSKDYEAPVNYQATSSPAKTDISNPINPAITQNNTNNSRNVLEDNPDLFAYLDVAPKTFFTGANKAPAIQIQDESENKVFSQEYSDRFFIYQRAFLGHHLTYDGNRVKKNDVQIIMASNKEAHSLYIRARNVNRTKNLMLFGGVGMLWADNLDTEVGAVGIIGTGMAVLSMIPMTVSSKLYYESFQVFHKDIVKASIIQANPTGVGLKIVF